MDNKRKGQGNRLLWSFTPGKRLWIDPLFQSFLFR